MHWENNPTLLSIMYIVGFILISSWVCSQFFFFEGAILIGPSSIFLEHLYAPICSPMAHLFSLYTCESWTLGKPYCLILNCYWEHLGEHFVNLMVSPWDQGMFFLNPSPPSPPKRGIGCLMNACWTFLLATWNFYFSKIICHHFWLKLMVGAQIMGQFNVLNTLICQYYQIQIHCNIKIINDF